MNRITTFVAAAAAAAAVDPLLLPTTRPYHIKLDVFHSFFSCFSRFSFSFRKTLLGLHRICFVSFFVGYNYVSFRMALT